MTTKLSLTYTLESGELPENQNEVRLGVRRVSRKHGRLYLAPVAGSTEALVLNVENIPALISANKVITVNTASGMITGVAFSKNQITKPASKPAEYGCHAGFVLKY